MSVEELAQDIRDIPVTVISGPPVDLTGVLAEHLHNIGYRKDSPVGNPHLSDEAVEAGARALCSLAGYEWEGAGVPSDVTVDFHTQLLEQARTIIEAALPHLTT